MTAATAKMFRPERNADQARKARAANELRKTAQIKPAKPRTQSALALCDAILATP